ncbi:NACHT domain-containing protein [Saccharopolyspora erythraea]|uniref:NACHT domain-containing protein n=1 Tax=Saccharopolyspora erythraea TaxID=1836 RepID=UPI001BAB1E77|nr:NACHT domain-containing protein [Saccharopolyspora erythraea]QUH04981.1 NACHT domain-containing protein [Saccharopolyspora erythraea]
MAEDERSRNEISGTVAGTAFQVGTVHGDVVFPRSSTRLDGDEPRAVLARQLADQVRALSRQEEETWRVGDPRPLPVRWQTAADDLFDHWDNMYGEAEDGGSVSLAGRFTCVRETYEAVPSGRLLILGRAGAGKTVLAHRLILGLLEEEDRTGPVPVLFSLGNWDPRSTSLRGWMAHQLVRDYPFLDAPDRTGKKGAGALVESNRVLPVLDGFDEIPERHHRDALGEMSRYDGPLVVTSRPDEYCRAARAAKALGRAAAIELDDLALDESERYLRASTSKTRTAEWKEVFGHLRAAPDDLASRNLAPVLASPLMVMLARATYNDARGNDPAELLDTDRFPAREAIEEHLLGGYLDTVYDPRRDTGTRRAARPSWGSDRARHWLGYLATHLKKRNTHDLAWWQLSGGIHLYARVLTTTLVTTLLAGLAIALAVGLARTLAVFRLAGGLIPGLPSGLTGMLTTALAIGVVVGLAAGPMNRMRFSRGGTGPEPERLRLRLRRRGSTKRSRVPILKSAVSEFAVGFSIGLTTGLAFAFAVGLTFRFSSGIVVSGLAQQLSFGLVEGLAGGLEVELAFGVAVGLVFGLALGVVNVVVLVLGDGQDPRDTITPWHLLAIDRKATLVRTTVVGTVVGLVLGLVDRGAVGLTFGPTFGVAAGMLRLALSAWGNWLLFVRLWLPLTGRLPWRPRSFLEDAYRRGVLRRAGAVYQFRHARLRDHLARRHQRSIEIGEQPAAPRR